MLLNVQTICAFVRTLVAGIVNTLPTNVPKLAGLPETTAFVSVQEAVFTVKLVAGVSVMVTALPTVVTGTGATVAG